MVFREDFWTAAFCSFESDLQASNSIAALATAVRADKLTTIQLIYHFFKHRKPVVLDEQKRGSHQTDMNAKVSHAIVRIDQIPGRPSAR